MTVRRSTIFDAIYTNGAQRVLKYINILHELCVTAIAAAATADCVGKEDKLKLLWLLGLTLFQSKPYCIILRGLSTVVSVMSCKPRTIKIIKTLTMYCISALCIFQSFIFIYCLQFLLYLYLFRSYVTHLNCLVVGDWTTKPRIIGQPARPPELPFGQRRAKFSLSLLFL